MPKKTLLAGFKRTRCPKEMSSPVSATCPSVVKMATVLSILLSGIFCSGTALGAGPEQQLTWGVNSVVLKPSLDRTVSLDDLLADRDHTIVLDRFYRVGGVSRPATPTECRVAYSSDAFFVIIRSKEKDMSFPVSDKFFPNTNREANWKLLKGSPGGYDSWPPFPDEVDFFIQPDPASPSYYQFIATPDGSTFACNRVVPANPDVTPDEAAAGWNSSVRVTKISDYEGSVVKQADEWVTFFKIPWATIGGKPNSHFGLLPIRTRWRDGEFSSPAAIDFEEWLPVDLMIEAHFAGEPAPSQNTTLCQLPSGVLRWQRPAVTPYPSVETRHAIWRLESSLATPTDGENLGQRLYLTQSWMDLMTQEGFTALPRAWGILTNNLTLAFFRERVNGALQQNDMTRACQLVDSYLAQLDQMSKWWYADRSPGDILQTEWAPVETVDQVEIKNDVLLMRGHAGSHSVDLHLALPKTGGVRIYTDDEGAIKPDGLLRLKTSRISNTFSIKVATGTVVVCQSPFSVSFHDSAGKEVTRIGANSLAFRFDSAGKIIAVDFRNHLDPDEAIYGFGEKYDHFNQHGNTLTLWGTDDWVGNGLGLRNTTYKIVPVIHSSKGYTMFDDSSYRLRADIGHTVADQMRITQPGPIFDYYFWIGTPKETLQSYTALTGRVPLPPKWVFEPWMGRGGGAWQGGPLHNPVAEEENTYNKFAALDIPHSAIYAEGPSANSPELNQFMAAHNIKVLGYFMPAVRHQESLMPELKPEEIPILNCGNPEITRELTYVDFTNPNAKELCRRDLKRALDVGIAGSMVDFGDMVPDSAVFHDGKRGDEMHNFYSYAYHRTISEIYRERRGNDFILYGRAAAPGTQKWVGQFAGDHPSDFDGLRAVLTGAMNLCACGFSTWGSDLGGYFGLPEPAVYMRWFQFGCFSPMMRPHGKATRDPWDFSDEAVTNYKFLAWTRENLLDYIYNAASVAHETGIPIMRSMPVSFPKESQLAGVGDQYMFGDDLLVAPVLNEDTFRTVSFPSGMWTSLWDGKTVSGPVEQKIDAPLDTIPVYLRPGAVVPVQFARELKFGQSMTGGRVSALIVTPPAGNETVAVLNEQGKAANVSVHGTSHAVSWKLEDRPETEYLLVYGASGNATVRVDGKTLPMWSGNETTSAAGWAADPASNRLVIHLSPDPNKATRTIEVNFKGSR
ncbi:MAG TPA: TIM-barrel domain-containing protein [Verrucomicrobiae bacterium]|nr:TIM-barrel domain-containing protein [Verrucomicrobiae bacterium]